LMVNELRKNSPILKEMEDPDEIKIVGAIYEMHNGTVEFFPISNKIHTHSR
jgi:carbonic anhydrase